MSKTEKLERFNSIKWIVDKLSFAKKHFPKAVDKFNNHTFPIDQTCKNFIKMVNEVAE